MIWVGDDVEILWGTLKGEIAKVLAVDNGMLHVRCYSFTVSIEETKVRKRG